MDEIIAILLIIGIAVLIMPIIAIVLAVKASRLSREIHGRLDKIERLQAKLHTPDHGFSPSHDKPTQPETRPPLPRMVNTIVPESARTETPTFILQSAPPPPLPTPAERREPSNDPPPSSALSEGPSFSLEKFMGVKLFAWLGGIAMFFGVIFFVKYAFERNLIPPAVRIALGFITGITLLTGGLWIHRRKTYKVLFHSLTATGILILYGVSFAAHALYHFPAFSSPVTFALMSLVTLAAFLIAVRLNAQVVAALGMIGGFLSPILLPSVQDNPFALFSYIALLDIGVLATTRYRPWKYLPAAAVTGTVLILIQWHDAFFIKAHYFEGVKTLTPMGILLFFTFLFGLAAWDKKRKTPSDIITTRSALAMNSIAILFAFGFLSHQAISLRPLLLYGFIFALNLVPIALSNIEPRVARFQTITALSTFLHLALWTAHCLTPDSLASALAIYLIFGALHAAYPIILQRFITPPTMPTANSQSAWFIPISLLLVFFAVYLQRSASISVWAVILVADLVVITLAARTSAILAVIGALVLTMGVAAMWLMRAPAHTDLVKPLLFVIILFGCLFTVAGFWLGHRKSNSECTATSARSALPILSAALPFGLLILATVQLPISNPTPIFGVSLLLSILLLGLMIIARQPQLSLLALVCTLAVEASWHFTRFDSQNPWIPFAWYIGFYSLFTLFPFICRRHCEKQIEPWIACALTGVGHFFLIHTLARQSFTETMGGVMGIIPIAFAIPSIAALLIIIRQAKEMDSTRQSKIAWLGGVSLLFITLVFPIQFDHQWLTVSWALEGAAVIWLFTRVPHQGLKWAGITLLAATFCRLALNPAVFDAYPRSGSAILNWHLYTYGVVAASLIFGGLKLPEYHRTYQNISISGILFAFAGVLLFLLLNIEIADFFTQKGKQFITFQFGGNFARDMTYSISWGLFSLGLLGLGIHFRVSAPRFTAIALLGVTLLKVFIYDLSNIESIYRIGALIGVAVIAFIASFLYQRFYNEPS